MKHKLRRGIDLGLTALGIALIITAVILGSSLDISMQLPLALVGVLLMEAGIWGVSVKFMPNDRRYNSLRGEGDRMLELIRDLTRPPSPRIAVKRTPAGSRTACRKCTTA